MGAERLAAGEGLGAERLAATEGAGLGALVAGEGAGAERLGIEVLPSGEGLDVAPGLWGGYTGM